MIESHLLKFSLYKNRSSWTWPAYQAHRGFCKNGEQENSLQAFQAAKKNGFKMIECDVLLSHDLVPVVTHDPDLQRLHGRPEMVDQLTAAELKNIAGIISLEELLSATDVPEYINIEIKGNQLLDSKIEILIAGIIEKTKSQNRIIFSTFNPMSLIKIKKIFPQIPCGWLVNPFIENGNFIFLRRLWLSPFLPFDYLHLHHSVITDQLLENAKLADISIAAWTVNDQMLAKDLLAKGVSGIITDDIIPMKENQHGK